MALRYFNAAGAHPDGTIGEDHAVEVHLIPLAIQAATGGTPLKVFGEDYPTPDGTCQRDYIHVCDLAEAHLCALAALERGAPSSAYNIGTGTPQSVRAVIDTVSRVVGTPGGLGGGAAAAGRSRPCCMRRATAPSASWTGRRATPISRSSSATPGSGIRPIRRGYRVSDTR